MTLAQKQSSSQRDKSTDPTGKTTELVASNPFSTRFLCPSKNRFIVADKQQLESFVENFTQNGFYGQLIGPHGCGKTTLSYAIERMILAKHSNHVVFHRKTIGANQRIRTAPAINGTRLHHLDNKSSEASARKTTASKTLVLVLDGIERLTWLQRAALMRHCFRRKIGLLVTTHRCVLGLGEQLRLQPSLQTFFKLAKQLQRDAYHQLVPAKLEQIYSLSDGNIREALMACYDAWETQR